MSTKYNDFAAFAERIKAMSDEQKSSLVVWEDEGIVRVDNGDDEQEFSDYAINFVHAFFHLLGVHVEDTISIK